MKAAESGIRRLTIKNAVMMSLRQKWKEMKKSRVSYLLIAPFCILFCVFYLIPVLSSIFLSFTYFNILERPQWIGWQNYINLFFADDVFLKAVKNTFIFAVVTGPVGYLASLLFAWFINELPRRMRAVMTLVFMHPRYRVRHTLFGVSFFQAICTGLSTAG